MRAALACAVLVASPSDAQTIAALYPEASSTATGSPARIAASALQELTGAVVDAKGGALHGVVVSALGTSSAYAVSDKDGRFVLRNLPPGPYVVRAHLLGYMPMRSRLVNVGEAQRPLAITLVRRASADAPPILAAGVGAVADPNAEPENDGHDHAEVAWRLRHSKRSVLKEAVDGVDTRSDDELWGPGRALAGAARVATAWMPQVDLNGQVHLFTSTTFDRPQDLFSAHGRTPRGVAYLALQAPGSAGEWRMKGTMTQGDLSSWIVSGSFTRSTEAAHAYEVGASYAMQRYLGGNAEALAALRDGSRNVGTLYGFDSWRVTPRVRVDYGARYGHYDYLDGPRLFSPRAGVEVQPVSSVPSLRVRVGASRSETAPGAVEFVTPALGVWLPPERTFSSLSAAPLSAQRVDNVDVAAEHTVGPVLVSAWAFRQATTNQVVSAFGMTPGAASSQTGHYYVGAMGDFDATGWGASATARLASQTRASLGLQRASTDWTRRLGAESLLVDLPDLAFRRADRVQAVSATVDSVLPQSDTRLVVVYRMIQAVGPAGEAITTTGGGRFDVQVTQALPFRVLTGSRWEALVAVKSLAYEAAPGASVYDEVLVLRPPTRVLGGVTVRF